MKQKRIVSAAAALCVSLTCFTPFCSAESEEMSVASYYTSNLASSDNGDGTYSNPVLYTDVADPDVICAPDPTDPTGQKEAYYMVSTAMSNSPGCPIMKSTDLVNWETVSYLYDTLDYDNDALALRNGKQAYGWGQWATSIKYSEKKQQFYILLFSYTTGTSQVYTSKDVENGPWKKSEFRTYHDCSIFIDDDGEPYIFYGQNSFYCKHLVEDANGFLQPEEEEGDPNNDGHMIVEHSGAYNVPDYLYPQYSDTTKGTLWDQIEKNSEGNPDFIIGGEGCHAYKVDGRYYLIFITWPGGNIWKRSEACFRSVPDANGKHSIYGPYEGMMVMSENVKYAGYTGGEGVAQGGMTNAIGGNVRSSEGNWYGIIYQDHGAAGRCPMLVNVDWKKPGYEGWPMMTTTETGNIPTESGEASEIKSLVESDEFDNGTKRATNTIITKPKTVDMTAAAEMTTASDGVRFNFMVKQDYWKNISGVSVAAQPNEWTELSGTFTVPDDWTGGNFVINTTDTNIDFYVDDCRFTDDEDGTDLIAETNGNMDGADIDNNTLWWWGVNNDNDTKTGKLSIADEWIEGTGAGYVSERQDADVGAMHGVELVPGKTYTVSAQVMYKESAEPDAPVLEKGYELSGEYITNGSMDGGTEGWGNWNNATISAESDGDNAVMKISGRGSADDGVLQFASADLKAGKTYKISMKVKSDTADTFRFVLLSNFWQDVEGAKAEVAPGEWTEISGYFDVPADFDGGSVRIVSENANADFLLDDVRLQLATETGTELVTNGDFETGTVEPFTGRYGHVNVEISDKSHGGSCSAYVSNRTSTGDGAKIDLDGMIKTPRDYTASAWVMYEEGPEERTFNLTLEHINDDGAMGWTVLASAAVKRGVWTQLTGTTTIGLDTGTKVNNIYIENPYNPSPSDDDLKPYYVDDISLVMQPEVEWETAEDGENDYNGSNLKLIWQWNHNPDNRYWSLTERPGWLRLRTAKVVDNIQQAKNTLTQRTFGPVCSGWTKLDVSKMRNGDYAGLAALQEGYGLLAVKKYGGRKTIVIVEPESEPNDAAKMMDIPTKETYIADLNQDEVYFKTEYEFHGEQWNDWVRFYYSLDGVNWTKAYEKNNLVYHLSHFTGYKFALFNYATNSLGNKIYGTDGYVDFDYFRVSDEITEDGTKTSNIAAELSCDNSVMPGVPNKAYKLSLTMDSLPTGAEKLEAAFTIPLNSELAEVDFAGGVRNGAYRLEDGKVIMTADGYTAGADRKLAELTFRTTGFITRNMNSNKENNYANYVNDALVQKISPDYIRVYGKDAEGREFDVNTTNATVEIQMQKPDYGSVIKEPGNGNPLITHKFGADPFALEYNGRLYLYLTGDSYYVDENGQITGSPETGAANNEYANAQSITVISTTDMVNWTDHGEIKAAGEDGAAPFSSYSWAPCIAMKNINGKDKFFLYYTDNTQGIVVLEGESPVGPFTSPLDKHLIGWEKDDEGNYLIPEVADCTWIFDPAVLVDDDGRAYLYFGGGTDAAKGGTDNDPGSARVVELGDDMISLKGEMQKIDAPAVLEDSGIHKYNGKYYYSYSTNWFCTNLPNTAIAYLVSDSPTGPFEAPEGSELAGIVLPPMGQYFDVYSNNHHAIFTYKGEWYIAYHCGLVDTGYHTTARYLGYRSAQIEKLKHNDNGTLKTTQPTRRGVDAVDTLNPYSRVEAETLAWHKEKVSSEYTTIKQKSPNDGSIIDLDINLENDAEKIKTAVCDEPGAEYAFNNLALVNLKNDDWSAVANARFGDAEKLSLKMKVKGIAGGKIEVYLDSLDGEKIAELDIPANSDYAVLEADAAAVSGDHNIFFKYVGGDGQLFEIDWWQFVDNTPKEWQLSGAVDGENVKAVAANIGAEDPNAVIYIASYDGDGKLASLEKEAITAAAGESKEITADASAAKIRIFLWSNTMKALADTVTVK